MKHLLAITCAVLLVAGCATSSSTARQIDRQINYLESLQKVHVALTDKLAEVGEQIDQGKKDLEALKEQRDAEVITEVIKKGVESIEK